MRDGNESRSTTSDRRWGLFVAAIALLAATPASAGPSYHRFHCARGNTIPTKIDAHGEITGNCYANRGYTSRFGFVRNEAGEISEFRATGNTDSVNTLPTDIADGVVVGSYEPIYTGDSRGFIGHAVGTITRFDVGDQNQTWATAYNNGVMTGYYGHFVNFNILLDGFTRTDDGKVTPFFVSDNQGRANATKPWDINSSGAIVGTYQHAYGDPQHGFVRAANGSITLFDPEGSVDTHALSINVGGDIVGHFTDSTGHVRGFLRKANGKIVTFRVLRLDTRAASINKAGAIAGTYSDANGTNHGFVRAPDGTITPFDVPNAASTTAVDINNAGEITGTWVKPSDLVYGDLTYGYVRTP